MGTREAHQSIVLGVNFPYNVQLDQCNPRRLKAPYVLVIIRRIRHLPMEYRCSVGKAGKVGCSRTSFDLTAHSSHCNMMFNLPSDSLCSIATTVDTINKYWQCSLELPCYLALSRLHQRILSWRGARLGSFQWKARWSDTGLTNPAPVHVTVPQVTFFFFLVPVVRQFGVSNNSGLPTAIEARGSVQHTSRWLSRRNMAKAAWISGISLRKKKATEPVPLSSLSN